MSEAIDDAQLGSLAWERNFGWWSGILNLSDVQRAELHISTPADDDLTITEQARQAFGRVVSSDEARRRKASDELLAIHNGSWNEGEPIDAATFMRRLNLTSVSIYPDGSAEVYYGDDDMFWGHVVIVTMSADGQCTGATIAG